MKAYLPAGLHGLGLGLWRFRYFILSSIRLEFYNRINRSRLGVFWLVVPPLAQVAIFSLILSAIMTERLPGIDSRFAYAIYLMSGIAAWSLFVETFNRALNVFLENANILKKITFPKLALPIIVYGISAINNGILLLFIILAYLMMGRVPTSSILWLPLLFVVCSMLAMSLGLILGILNVFIRDVGQFAAIGLQVGFWFTPVVYLPTIVPEQVRWLLKLNPMYWVVSAYHDVMVFGRHPHLPSIAALIILVLALSAIALMLYRRASAEMVDVL